MGQRIQGVLLGLAWGDVLGCPVEYWSKSLISEVYSKYESLPGIYPLDVIPRDIEIISHLRPLGMHSDDTQQALTLIHACLHPDGWDVARWANYLLKGNDCQAWRGTGRNFRSAVKNMASGLAPLTCGSQSAGIGGAMRIAPLGAIFRNDLPNLGRVVFESTYSTHADVRAVSMAYAVALACALLIEGRSISNIEFNLPRMVENFESDLRTGGIVIAKQEHWHTVSRILYFSLHTKIGDTESFRCLLEDYVRKNFLELEDIVHFPNHPFAPIGGAYALRMGLWPEAKPDLILAEVVQQGGDADTMGAIAGSILGARFGTDWIPIQRCIDCEKLLEYSVSLLSLSVPESFEALLEREFKLSLQEREFTASLTKSVND